MWCHNFLNIAVGVIIFPKDTGCTILCIFTTYHTILKILQKTSLYKGTENFWNSSICYSASSHSNVMWDMLYSRKTWVLDQEIHWQEGLETPSNNGFLLSSLEERVEQFKFDTNSVKSFVALRAEDFDTLLWTSYQHIDFGWLDSVLVPILASFVSVQTQCSCIFSCPPVNLWYKIFPHFTQCCWYWLLFYITLIGIFPGCMLCHGNANESSLCNWWYLSHSLSTVWESCTWLSACLTFHCW
jgi:hypothetical protein